jgi:hypothetical protein
VRETPVHALVDPGETEAYLFNSPVQIVNPALEGYGEVDEIVAASAEEDALGLTNATELQVEGDREDEGDPRRRRGADRNPAGDIAAQRYDSLCDA